MDSGLFNRYLRYYGKQYFSGVIRKFANFDRFEKYIEFPSDTGRVLSLPLEKPIFCLNSPCRITAIIRETEQTRKIYAEAQFKTYPTKTLVKCEREFININIDKQLKKLKYSDILCDSPNAEKIIDTVILSDEDKEISPLVGFYIPFFQNKKDDALKLIRKMATRLYVCGYNFSSTEYINVQVQPFIGNPIAIAYVQFEALYSDLDIEFSNMLYYVSLKSLFNKVQKNGLIPKSSSIEFSYPDRLYLFNQVSIETIIEYAATKAKTAKVHEMCIYCINSNKLKNYKLFKDGRLKFYRDPAFSLSQQKTDQTAIFTYGVIPRNLLENRLLYVEFTQNYSVKQTKWLAM